MRRLGLIIVMINAIFMLSNAQQKGANISFSTETHDFGEIKENGGEVAFKFEFTNTGNEPLIINNVKPSCGCTSPKWSKEPVLPGANGFIETKFNPQGRKGPFNKSIAVTTNGNTTNTVLHITGNVLEGEKTLEEIYRYKMGDIRLMRRNVYFASIEPEETKSETLEIVNPTDKDITVLFKGVPDHIKIEVEPATLKPEEKGIIKATFDASKIDDWGSVNNWVVFSTDGNLYNNRLAISANIQEDFSKLTPEDIKNAPKVLFSETNFEFGNIKQGETVEHDFEIKNEGKSDLIIRKVTASCGCTAANPTKNVIAPGESTTLKVTFNSRGKKGKQNKTVTVITNDPSNFKKVLWVKGNVDDLASN